jgi:hypothetical protein
MGRSGCALLVWLPVPPGAAVRDRTDRNHIPGLEEPQLVRPGKVDPSVLREIQDSDRDHSFSPGLGEYWHDT